MLKRSREDSLKLVKQKLEAGLYLRASSYVPGRQTWGGAGVIVRFPTPSCSDLGITSQDSTASGAFSDEVFETPFAGAVASLYRDIRHVAGFASGYNHLSKHHFWGELTKSGKCFVARGEGVDGESLLKHLWAVAREMIAEMERTRD